MKKTFLYLFILLLMVTGCKNKKEDVKSEYLKMKSELLEIDKFTSNESLPCSISVNVKRLNKEKVSYEVVISDAKENMNNIRGIVVHNYYTEEIFPSIGLFDEKLSLKTNSDEDIILKGNIDTTVDIDDLDLSLKLMIEYEDDSGEVKDIYYKST